ncbi:MAG TPA: PAS domain S-box protein [Bdellovibrionales bacterium]|nr:PAS domain S-box protein [Bdellovibrionales bacterium]
MSRDGAGLRERWLAWPGGARLAAGLGVAVLALVLQYGINLIYPLPPFMFLYPAVFLAARFFGVAAGAVACVGATAGAGLLLLETARFAGDDAADPFWRLKAFAALSGVMLWLVHHDRKRELQISAAMNAAAEEAERCRQTFEQASIGVGHTDLNGKWLKVNHHYCRIVGYTRDELLKKRFVDITHPEDRDKDWLAARRLTAGEIDTYSVEKRYIRKDGSTVWVSLTVSVLRNPDGSPVHFISFVEDITAKREVRIQLEAAKEQLQAALKARDEFISVASHELKTPISALMLQTQVEGRLLKKGESELSEPSNLGRMLGQTETQLRRITRLVDDMLDVSRIRSGKLMLKKERIALDNVIRDVLERLNPNLAEAGSPATFECETSIEGEWDRLRLEQVVMNLLTNAMRYGRGKPVTVRLEKLLGARETARLSVSDRGIGVPAELRDRIFDRFERGDDTNNLAGLGLGLYITRQIIESHGGRVWVESEGPAKGSTFKVELPV